MVWLFQIYFTVKKLLRNLQRISSPIYFAERTIFDDYKEIK